MDISQKILSTLQSHRNVFLVGSSDSGKTWYAQNELKPFLEKHGLRVLFFEDCNQITEKIAGDVDFVIVDEIEILQDLSFLEVAHPDEVPYFSTEYIAKIKEWFRNLKSINQPGVFIVTREKDAIQNFVHSVKTLDWNNHEAEVIEFSRPSK